MREQREREAVIWRTEVRELKDAAKRKGRKAHQKESGAIQDGKASGENQAGTTKEKTPPQAGGISDNKTKKNKANRFRHRTRKSRTETTVNLIP